MSRDRKSEWPICIMILISCACFYFQPIVARAQETAPTAMKPLQLKPKQVKPVQLFSTIDHGDVELAPPMITIRYGQSVLTLNQGGNGTINVPENSNLLDPQGRVSMTIEYTLRNKTAKAFQFNAVLVYENTTVGTAPVTLFGNGSKTVSQTVSMQSTNQAKSLRIQGPVGVSDDTPIIFFNASLWTRVYPL
jgi:hypothetical protein